MSFFSIIIPVYNVEKYLERCLQSILTDSCKDIEIILVDDGSTDASGELCDRFAEQYSCIKVIHKPNGGLSSARNAGLDVASGEWISFVDSDDWVDQDTYSRMKDILTAPENRLIDIVKLGYKKILKDRVVSFKTCLTPGLYEGEKIREEILATALGSRLISNSTNNTVILSSCAHLYRNDFLSETGIRFISERDIGSEDFLFIYSLYMRASRILVTDLIWYNYDTRDGSLTCRYREKLYEQYKKLGKAVYLQMKETGLYSAHRLDFEGLYISLMYMCIINECNYSANRLKNVQRVKTILRNKKLQKCLSAYCTEDRKSLIISKLMKYHLAFPLCVIQWRKKEKAI